MWDLKTVCDLPTLCDLKKKKKNSEREDTAIKNSRNTERMK